MLLTDPPDWVPDEVCSYCTACKAPFTVIRRKHHCRSCGKVTTQSGMGEPTESHVLLPKNCKRWVFVFVNCSAMWDGCGVQVKSAFPHSAPQGTQVQSPLVFQIFCSRCSSHSAPLPRYGQMKPVRVCTHCYMFHVTPFYSDKAGI